MLIKRLVLENIRSYTNQVIDFPVGALLLSGDIGAGKSTILQSVEFALFGSKRKQLSGESLLRHGSKEGRVQLTLNISGKDLTIMRTLKLARGSVVQGAGYIIENGTKKEGTAIELKSWILNYLGYPAEYVSRSHDLIYRYTVYTPQEAMKAILFEDKDLRLETLRRVFGIDKYKRVRENISIMARHYREQIKMLEGEISVLQGVEDKQKQIAQAIKESKQALEDAHGAVKSNERELAEFEKKHELLERRLSELIKIQEKISVQEALLKESIGRAHQASIDLDKMMQEKKALEAKLNSMNLQEDKTDSVDNMQNDLEQLQQAHNSIEKSISTFIERSKGLEEEIRTAEQDRKALQENEQTIAKITGQLEEMEKRLTQESDQKDTLNGLEDELEQLNSALAKSLSQLESIEDNAQKISGQNKCPVCLQPVSDEVIKHITSERAGTISKLKRVIKHLESEKKTLLEKKIALQASLEQMAKLHTDASALRQKKESTFERIRELRVRVSQASGKSRQLDELKRGIEEKKAEAGRLSEAIASVKGKLDVVARLQKRLQEAREIKIRLEELETKISSETNNREKAKQQVASINAALRELRSKEGAFDDDKKSFESLKSLVKSGREKLQASQIKKAEAAKSLESLKVQKESLDDEIHALGKKRKKKSKVTRLKAWLEETFSKITEAMEKGALQKLYSDFNTFFAQWFNILIEEEALSARLNDEFSPVIIQNGYETQIENLSGGEKTSLALAYRLALNKVINDFMGEVKTKDIIMLDEPTDGFSSDQLEKVRDVLEELSVKQAIIVSHEPKIESFVDHVIRIRKQEHKSEVVV